MTIVTERRREKKPRLFNNGTPPYRLSPYRAVVLLLLRTTALSQTLLSMSVSFETIQTNHTHTHTLSFNSPFCINTLQALHFQFTSSIVLNLYFTTTRVSLPSSQDQNRHSKQTNKQTNKTHTSKTRQEGEGGGLAAYLPASHIHTHIHNGSSTIPRIRQPLLLRPIQNPQRPAPTRFPPSASLSLQHLLPPIEAQIRALSHRSRPRECTPTQGTGRTMR